MNYLHSVEEAWRKMRALRHKPPNHAKKGNRKLLFSAAAKQSEQFFKFSDVAGYETKPVLLCYRLYQAARAIAASMAEGKSKWELRGHGIHPSNLDSDPAALGDLLIAPQGSGSFQALAEILHSPALSGEVPLRDVWMSLPEGASVALQGTEKTWGAAKLKRIDGGNVQASLATYPWDEFKPVMRLSHLPELLVSMDKPSAMALLKTMYPRLQNFVPIWHAYDNTPNFDWHATERLSLNMAYYSAKEPYRSEEEPGEVVTGYDILRCGPPAYGRPREVSTWTIPVVGENSEPMQPLIGWWTVLYALSMLARYKPKNWTTMLDIDVSSDAPAIEYLLDEAHQACINLIMYVFDSYEYHHVHTMPKDVAEARKRQVESFFAQP
jgi:YaaC-like protein